MEQNIECNIINTLYYLYFENRELVWHFERIWSEDGSRYRDEEFAYIFLGMKNPHFEVDLETCYFLKHYKLIEETSGNEHECIFELSEYHRMFLTTILKEKSKKRKSNKENTIVIDLI